MIKYIFLLIILLYYGNVVCQNYDSQHYCQDSIEKYYVFDRPGTFDYNTLYNNLKKSLQVVNDKDLSWYRRSLGYWNSFMFYGRLLTKDELMKEFWDEAFKHDPWIMCSLLEEKINPVKQSFDYAESDKVFLYYLLRESEYYGCMCNTYYESFSQEIHDQLEEILKRDQSNDRDNSPETQKKIDDENLAKVEKIIVNLGKYPGRSIVGKKLESAAWFVIQHAELDVILKYENLIKKSIFEDHDLTDKYWAYFKDRIQVGQRMKQKYGTQFYTNKRKNILYELEDFKNIDKIRAKLWLDPLHEYCTENSIEYYEREGKILKF